MRKYGSSKRNPNPPWPGEQSVVVVPPGSNAAAIGQVNEQVRSAGSQTMQNDDSNVMHSRDNQMPLMGYAQEDNRTSQMPYMQENNQAPQRPYTQENQASQMPYTQRNNRTSQMQYMQGNTAASQMGSMSMMNNGCGAVGISTYLCQRVGNYARVEFLFGENMHIEKTGILENVGKDFIVLTEAGTGSHIVCSVNNIKFINIYNLNNN